MKCAPAKKIEPIASNNPKRTQTNSIEEPKLFSMKPTQKAMGEQSKKLLKELIPLIRYCKEKDSKQTSTKVNAANHKKSFSISPNIINNQDNPKASNKSVIHIHQKSTVPNEIKLECPTFDAIMEKAEKIIVNPNSKTIMQPQKITKTNSSFYKNTFHKRAKSDCQNAIPRKVPQEAKMEQPITKPINKIFKSKRDNTPLVYKVELSKKDKESYHRRSASDKVSPPKDRPIKSQLSKEKDYYSIAQSIKTKVQATPKDRIVNNKSIGNKGNQNNESNHKRSISTQIKINTYLQDTSAETNSKVISITQDTKIEPLRSNYDIDIVNIAIKQKETSNKESNIAMKLSKEKKIMENTPTKFSFYENLSKENNNNKKIAEGILKVGKDYFKCQKPAQLSKDKKIVQKTEVSSKCNSKLESPKQEENKVREKKATTGNGLNKISSSLSKKIEAPKLSIENVSKLDFEKEINTLIDRIKTRKYFIYVNLTLDFAKYNEAPPTTTEFYRVGKLLGKGAFGKVNLGMHKLTGKMVAIKSINKEYLTDENSKKKVMQEFSILKQIRHPSVIQLYETFESTKHILFVIELCCGGDLLSYVRKKKKLSEPMSKSIFKNLIDGLNYCHSKGVLHRDIKLDNILLNAAGHIKICDFGVSKQVREGEIMTEQSGTPAYIAPEILRDKGYEGFAVDVWSAGVVLYAMLYGTVPFKANDMKLLHKLIMKGNRIINKFARQIHS